MNLNQKGPLNPQDLFRRLMTANYQKVQCIDQGSKLRQQRQILIQLILEYQSEIQKINLFLVQEEKLVKYRQRLVLQLQQLQKERQVIDGKIGRQIETLRLTPIQMRDRASLLSEMDVTRSRNNKLKIRIKDLMGYINTLQIQNKRLEEERKIINSNQMQRRQTAQYNWRMKIDLLKRENFSYENQIRQKIQSKLQTSRRKIEAQQLQIQERNRRRRMVSFKNNGVQQSQHHSVHLSSPYAKIDDRQIYNDRT